MEITARSPELAEGVPEWHATLNVAIGFALGAGAHHRDMKDYGSRVDSRLSCGVGYAHFAMHCLAFLVHD